MPAFTDYKIAAGHNNAGGLTLIGLIVPAGDIAFPEPTARLSYSPGVRRVRLDQQLYVAGFPAQTWEMPFLSLPQYQYLKTTYCGGGYSGLVTVRTRWNAGAYAHFNAVLQVPLEPELESLQAGNKWVRVPLKLMNLVAL
jgi:hypothetical protein